MFFLQVVHGFRVVSVEDLGPVVVAGMYVLLYLLCLFVNLFYESRVRFELAVGSGNGIWIFVGHGSWASMMTLMVIEIGFRWS